uniref:Uncharacterized protein n=1 Tax=Candidatus Kentrum sp. UNK TaxID=2126344 RepID=A0A451AVC2_9GAMM|nr:MAG: hypothetical protein BECKUNK1418G_GA0071005_101916 [Candidatus Kentron sp. UNK]VFK69996.1 MAG: hypothetical protein BECKUNK1418H_GA0071006_102216 [Candidatus Kentron sp. UNK]
MVFLILYFSNGFIIVEYGKRNYLGYDYAPPPPPGNQAKIRARNLERAIPDVLRTCHSKIFGHFEAESVAMFKNELLKS